jgi:small-conductance mechanosensitive channel
VIIELIHLIDRLIHFLITKHLQKIKQEKESEHSEQISRILRLGLKIIFAVFGFLLILSNLGVDVSSLLAGLGIGGIAVALAMQNILSDVFSSISIYIDRPFKIGDYIVVGKEMGTVEKIGLKSTRLRSLHGEEIIISNRELTNTRLQNFKTMERRRVALDFGVSYDTERSVLEKIPHLVQQIIEAIEGLQFDRCHLVAFGDFSLNFELVYHVESGKFQKYIETKQHVLLKLIEVFRKQGIEFAYPTQVVLYEKLKK